MGTWGTAPLFTPSRPWLLDMFDQIRFYPVTEEELEKLRKNFKCGSFVPTISEEVFDMKDYTNFLKSISEEIEIHKKRQAEAAKVQSLMEQKYLQKQSELLDEAVDEAADIPAEGEPVEAVVSAQVWDIQVAVGDEVQTGDELMTLEAMKMEFKVKAPITGIVTHICHDRGSLVHAGHPLLYIKDESSQI